MRIQHNITALNSYRNLGINNSAVSKNLEKLSSGYRINRAGDDAAGLAISEKMRSQITGLETAQKNAQDGISLVQTAEGALTEVHSMLNRMVELATQSSNGIYTDSDRAKLNDEINQLNDEIDRISEATNFNGINLLDGSLASKAGVSGVTTDIAGTTTPLAATGGAKFSQVLTFAQGTDEETQTVELAYLDKDGVAQNATISFTAGSTAAETGTSALEALKGVFGEGYTLTASAAAITITANEIVGEETSVLKMTQYDGTSTTAETTTVAAATAGKDNLYTATLNTADLADEIFLEVDGQKFQVLSEGKTAEAGYTGIFVDQQTGALTGDSIKEVATQLQELGIDVKATATALEFTEKTDSSVKGGLTLQIGDTSDQFNKLIVGVQDMSADALGLGSLDISTYEGASAAIDAINAAIEKVSTTRSAMGAIQNRLDHTINNLGVTTENMTAAESRIRDVDMAKEMMEYTKNNILVQSSQAMLAQANQIPQGVLQLLQ